jgi:hypothetical protein
LAARNELSKQVDAANGMLGRDSWQPRLQARTADLLKVLAARGLPLSQLRRDDVEQLDRWFDRALTASTAEEVFQH